MYPGKDFHMYVVFNPVLDSHTSKYIICLSNVQARVKLKNCSNRNMPVIDFILPFLLFVC